MIRARICTRVIALVAAYAIALHGHCKFCIGQTHAMAPGPSSCGVQFNFRTPREPIWFVLNQDDAGGPRYLRKERRGPPAAT
jgi:hypothetical protein